MIITASDFEVDFFAETQGFLSELRHRSLDLFAFLDPAFHEALVE